MSDRAAPFGIVTTTLLVLTAVAGQFVVRDRVGTHRPSAAGHAGIPLPGGQNVDARLWQDPLAAVLAAQPTGDADEQQEKGDEQLRHLSRKIEEKLDEKPPKGGSNEAPRVLTMLPVFIPAGAYAESAETRRRYRVAVVSALMTASFVPASTEHIGSFPFTPWLGDDLASEPMPIAYEWYERSALSPTHPDSPDTVLVLWLPDRALGNDPLYGAEQVVCEPLRAIITECDSDEKEGLLKRMRQRIRFRVVGPSNSDSLAAMVQSLMKRRAERAAFDQETPFESAEQLEAFVEKRVGQTSEADQGEWNKAVEQLIEEGPEKSRVTLQQAIAAEKRHRTRAKTHAQVQESSREFLARYIEAREDTRLTDDAESRAAIRDRLAAYLSPNARIFSPRATVPDAHILEWAAEKSQLTSDQPSIRELFATETHPDVFTRTNCTDEVLACSVLQELAKRGVRPGEDRIALIVERDSLYGRTLERTFEAAVEAFRRAGSDKVSATSLLGSWRTGKSEPPTDDTSVEVFSYLRGIDGVTPGTRSSPPKPGGDRESTPKNTEDLIRSILDSDATLPGNYAFGANQFDRVLQLADTIERRGSAASGSFRAIGIVGSDIYDKLAILQALKPQFPDQVFFTTDLDARLVPNELTPFTRNLVVVSGFGDELAPAIQRDTGAFRDSYQAAIFLATLLGVGDQAARSRFDEDTLTPRTFEIGRTRPVELGPNPNRSQLHPGIESVQFEPRPVLLWILFFALAAYVSYRVWRMLRRELRRLTVQDVETRHHVFWFGLAGMATLGLLSVYGAMSFLWTRDGEPFYWFQGVSLWPTEFIRIAAGMGGVCLLWAGWLSIRHSDVGISSDFFAQRDPKTRKLVTPPLPPEDSSALTFGDHLRRCSLRRFDPSDPTKNDGPATPLAAWQLYLELGGWVPRIVRILPLLAISLGIAAVSLLWDPAPRAPYRGGFADWIDLLVGGSSVFVTAFLALSVADSARLSSALARALGKAHGAWPDSDAAATLLHEHGLHGRDVAEHLRVDVMCRRTTAVGGLFWFPFAVMALMTFAQHATFDAWRWAPPFIAVMLILAVTVFFSGVVLLRTTRRLRDSALARVHRRISELQARGDSEQVVGRHKRLLTSAKEIDIGAFSGLRSPMIDAVLLPSGGLAVLSLLELAAVVMTG